MTDQIDETGLPLWPAAERNKGPIVEQLSRWLGQQSGLLLEVAAGTGQHALHFAPALPQWRYQPSDVDDEHLHTLALRVARSGQKNLHPPLRLDVTQPIWPLDRCDAIYCANLIHIAPWAAAQGLMIGAGKLLPSRGLLFTYGPYRVAGQHTAPSNEQFDESLRRRNPDWGVRDVDELKELASREGLVLVEKMAMPANNFLLAWRKETSAT